MLAHMMQKLTSQYLKYFKIYNNLDLKILFYMEDKKVNKKLRQLIYKYLIPNK